MALGTPTLTTAGSSSTDTTAYTTASVTLTAGVPYVLLMVTGVSSSTLGAPTITGNGAGNWTALGQGIAGNSSFTSYSFWTVGTGSTGTITMTFAQTKSNIGWRLVELPGADTTAPIRQSVVEASAAVANNTATLPSAPLSTSLVLSYIGANMGSAPTLVQPTGHTTLGARTDLSSPVVAAWASYDPPAAAQSATWSSSNTAAKVHTLLEIQEAPSTSTTYAAAGAADATGAAIGSATSRALSSGVAPAVSTSVVSVPSSRALSSGVASAISTASASVTSRAAASGAVTAISTAVAAVTSRLTSAGAATLTSAALGAATSLLPAPAPPVAATSTASGSATVLPRTYDAAGTAAAVSSSSGSVVVAPRDDLSAGGTASATAGAGGAATSRLRASGSAALLSSAAGSGTSRLRAAGTAPFTSAVVSSFASAQLPSSGAASTVSGSTGAADVLAGPRGYEAGGTAGAATGSIGSAAHLKVAAGSARTYADASAEATSLLLSTWVVDPESTATGECAALLLAGGAADAVTEASGSAEVPGAQRDITVVSMATRRRVVDVVARPQQAVVTEQQPDPLPAPNRQRPVIIQERP